MKIAIVGFGKIAQDQHLPAIRDSGTFDLAATASRHAHADGLPAYRDIESLLAGEPDIPAISLCQPPQVRHAAARAAIAAGRHVFLEKPPGATVAEVSALDALAARGGRTLFASWHSRHAAGVAAAREWLADKRVTSVEIVWREDVRVWHPGQAWIWEAGGLGVFDPGINALSIVTHILPFPIFVEDGRLYRPANRAAPIAAALRFAGSEGVPVTMDLDWRQTGPQSWDIRVETDAGPLCLSSGGAVLSVDGETRRAPDREYPGLYAQFAALIREGRSDADTRPLQLVADAWLRCPMELVEAFED